MNNGYDKYENMKQVMMVYMWIWHNFTFGLQTEQSFLGCSCTRNNENHTFFANIVYRQKFMIKTCGLRVRLEETEKV